MWRERHEVGLGRPFFLLFFFFEQKWVQLSRVPHRTKHLRRFRRLGTNCYKITERAMLQGIVYMRGKPFTVCVCFPLTAVAGEIEGKLSHLVQFFFFVALTTQAVFLCAWAPCPWVHHRAGVKQRQMVVLQRDECAVVATTPGAIPSGYFCWSC